ncbi:hypothetical protein AWZ03_002416 [Drosophila navojoa]|uniref:Uncharacterized protein n=1 Tax=Drosophila navojoa TaxID=7232 RepID=A0A484BQP1_DRONA|nr:hypothetical protein AWZ03_002416 [Drosophila navojoa]
MSAQNFGVVKIFESVCATRAGRIRNVMPLDSNSNSNSSLILFGEQLKSSVETTTSTPPHLTVVNRKELAGLADSV